MKFLRRMPALAFWAGVILLSVNIVGLFTSLRNPAVYKEHTPNRRPAAITEEQFYQRIDSYDGDRREYVTTVTRAIGDALAHYWEDAGIESFHLRIPFYENYLLFLASYIYPAQYQKYEFMDYRKAVERGVGLCSECAVIETEILKRKGIRARIVSLRRHIVVEGEVDPVNHEWWMLDPDFGITVPHDLAAIQADPALIRPLYIADGRDEKTVSMLESIFRDEPRTVFEGNGAAPYAPQDENRGAAVIRIHLGDPGGADAACADPGVPPPASPRVAGLTRFVAANQAAPYREPVC